MVEISDQRGLRDWLDQLPLEQKREAAVLIASRSALRVLPIVNGHLRHPPYNWSEQRIIEETLLPGFFASFIAWIASFEFINQDNVETFKHFYNDKIAHLKNYSDVRAASSASHAASKAALVAISPSIAQVAIELAICLKSAAEAAANALAAMSGAWHAVGNDASNCERLGVQAARGQPLEWTGAAKTRALWSELVAGLRRSNSDFAHWIRWYEAVRDGWSMPDTDARLKRIHDALDPDTRKDGLKLIDALIKGLMAGEGAGKAKVLAPEDFPGAHFLVKDGQLVLRAVPLDDEEATNLPQRRLHERIVRRLGLLKEYTDRVGNTHRGLKVVIDEYVVEADRPFDEIDIDVLWSVGNGLIAQAEAFREFNSALSTSYPLEPEHLGVLIDVAGLHGGFILGFERGRDLVDKADKARLAAQIIAAIEKPMLGLLDGLSRQHDSVDARTRQFLAAVAEGVRAAGWDTARTGHTAYAATRNALLAIGRAILWVNEKGGTIVGGLALGEIDPAFAETTKWLQFFAANSREIMSFAVHFPELRAWLGGIIDHMDDEQK